MLYSVLIIGAGKIGAFFDAPESRAFLTHAHVFSAHPGFNLLGFFDADPGQARKAADIWGGEAFPTVEEAFVRHKVDVAVVAVPDQYHYPVLQALAAYPLRLVFAEKPLTTSIAESATIIRRYHACSISLAVNFSRRFLPEFAALRDEIAKGLFGAYLAGTGYYGKGTLHNGSHMVDLLRFLLGDIERTETIAAVYDHYADDPSCSAILTFPKGERFVMQAVDSRCFTIFEMELVFEQCRIRMAHSGFRLERNVVGDDDLFKGYRSLKPATAYATGLDMALKAAVANIHAHLTAGEALACSGEDGMAAQKICTAILDALP